GPGWAGSGAGVRAQELQIRTSARKLAKCWQHLVECTPISPAVDIDGQGSRMQSPHALWSAIECLDDTQGTARRLGDCSSAYECNCRRAPPRLCLHKPAPRYPWHRSRGAGSQNIFRTTEYLPSVMGREKERSSRWLRLRPPRPPLRRRRSP